MRECYRLTLRCPDCGRAKEVTNSDFRRLRSAYCRPCALKRSTAAVHQFIDWYWFNRFDYRLTGPYARRAVALTHKPPEYKKGWLLVKYNRQNGEWLQYNSREVPEALIGHLGAAAAAARIATPMSLVREKVSRPVRGRYF